MDHRCPFCGSQPVKLFARLEGVLSDGWKIGGWACQTCATEVPLLVGGISVVEMAGGE